MEMEKEKEKEKKGRRSRLFSLRQPSDSGEKSSRLANK